MVREAVVTGALSLLAGGAFGIAGPMQAEAEPPPDIVLPAGGGR